MKRLTIVLLIACAPLMCKGQDLSMATLFKAMPDSLFPYLSKNNRLDLVDFREAGMKAEVTNLLDGRSEMTFLSSDSLSLQISNVLRLDMKLEPIAQPTDSNKVAIHVWRTYQLNDKQTERVADVYSAAWQFIRSEVERSSLLREFPLTTIPPTHN